jgi:NADH dehydrogenase FAD-containing subunit
MIEQKLPYDYLILATGATYTSPISPTREEMTLQDRRLGWMVAHQRLTQARSVIILGGGAVGVELAAEIVELSQPSLSSPPKVTIVDAQTTLVSNFPKSVGNYAQQWLSDRGVKFLLGQKLSSWNDTSCTLDDGTVLEADIVYVCFGSRPNSTPMNTPLFDHIGNQSSLSSLFTLKDRQTVLVKDTLQVVPHKRPLHMSSSSTSWLDDGTIFACGDVATPPTNDEKQAFQAEMQGKVAATNVVRLLMMSDCAAGTTTASRPTMELQRYPQDIAGSKRTPLVFVLSLGRYDGVVGFNNLSFPGPVAAIIKWILEYTKVLHMQGDFLGKVIWKIGDELALFLSRTLIPASGHLSGTHVSQNIQSIRKKKD